MKLLLDTHAFIWWDSDPSRLSSRVVSLCQNRANLVLLSVVSVWEMQIKHQLGKLRLGLPLRELVETHKQANDIQVLPINLEHVLELESLPAVHADPFDRLLVAQARVEGTVLLSHDSAFEDYPVAVAW
ncbi:MAG: type II toxin-antitoxin system VapC family toxin [bacterium]